MSTVEGSADVYCGVVPPGCMGWPLPAPLVVEVEVRRGASYVERVRIGVPLPCLQEYLTRNLVGRPIGDAPYIGDGDSGQYRAPYWRAVRGALALALREYRRFRSDDPLGGLLARPTVAEGSCVESAA